MDVITPPKVFQPRTNSVKTTRHTWATFVPMRLFKELSKSFNLFFLFLCCVVLVPNLTPFSRTSYIVCVAVVLSTNIVKTALSEFKRYQADCLTNTQRFTAIRKGTVLPIHREDINPGEFLIIDSGVFLPVDVLLLGACTGEHRKHHVYIETSSLNGESALKIRKPLFLIGQSGDVTEPDLATLNDIAQVEINRPEGCGTLHLRPSSTHSPAQLPFRPESLILKGCSVYGSSRIIGLSLGGNSDQSQHRIKNSLFMKTLSQKTLLLILIYLGILFIASFSSCQFIISSSWLTSLYPDLPLPVLAIRNFASNLLIFSSLVPLSLFVTLDGLRIAYSVYIQSDRQMALNGQFCENNTHGIVEDMGLLTHVLTDKTGTLTQNQMVFKAIHLNGQPNPLFFDQTTLDCLLAARYGLLTLLALLLCQSVEVVEGEYRGVSQEETAILTQLKSLGARVLARDDQLLTLQIADQVITCRLLGVLPFSPALSRMAVLVELGPRRFLFVKGSDEVVDSTGALPVDGKYRALTVAAREVAPGELRPATRPISFFGQMALTEIGQLPGGTAAAETAPLVDPAVLQELEPAATYIATTYIEDVLQDDVVPAIQQLKQQHLRVWMITGDRQASAVSCGAQTRILTPETTVLSGKEAINRLLQEHTLRAQRFVRESGVIVFRATPEDKKQITRLIRQEGSIVLSVGDGENDVGMIEEADVGICVIGKEGKKAAFVSDIIIPTFSSLARLVTFHGSGCLERLRSVYFFYVFKSMAGAVCQMLYGVSVGSSGSIASSSLFLLLYNSVITSPLSVEIGLFRSRSVVGSVTESVWVGFLYGAASFLIVYQAFSPVDAIDGVGTTAGHPVVSRVFSVCLFISTLIHFIFVADSFVAVSPVTIGLALAFFFISIGLDGGFNLFGQPAIYLIVAFMVTTGLAIERLAALVRRKSERYVVTNLSSLEGG